MAVKTSHAGELMSIVPAQAEANKEKQNARQGHGGFKKREQPDYSIECETLVEMLALVVVSVRNKISLFALVGAICL